MFLIELEDAFFYRIGDTVLCATSGSRFVLAFLATVDLPCAFF